MVAIFSKGDLLLRLSPDRVTELVDRGDGKPDDPGAGPTKDRGVVPYGTQTTYRGEVD
jgi:hypothetical protein